MNRAIVRIRDGQITDGIGVAIGIDVALDLEDAQGTGDFQRAARQAAVNRRHVFVMTFGGKTEHHRADELHQRRFSGFVMAKKHRDLVRQRFDGQAFPDSETVDLKIRYFHRAYSLSQLLVTFSLCISHRYFDVAPANCHNCPRFRSVPCVWPGIRRPPSR